MWTLIIIGVLAGQPVTLQVPGFDSDELCSAALKRAVTHLSGGGAFCAQLHYGEPAKSGALVVPSPTIPQLLSPMCGRKIPPEWCGPTGHNFITLEAHY
jgi:hypothetical protein